MTITNIALGKLSLSPLNVRKTERDADIEALADDIAARGLKQNLVAVANGKAGHFEVVAGGRRFQALQILVDRKVMKKTDPVPVLVEEREQGVETSLAENLHRVAMNPADELDAFRAIIDAAEGNEAERIAYCAKRFGVGVRHVEQRLRLARLAPEILEALRGGAITLDVAKAFAGTDDHQRQLDVWAASLQGRHGAQHVRSLVGQGSVTNADRRAILVGRTAYEAAGGRVEADLFAAVGTERWVDVPLLERLAQERMVSLAADIQAAEGFAEVVPLTTQHVDYEATKSLDNWYPRLSAKPADDAGEKIAKLLAAQNELGDQLEAAGDYDADDEGRPTEPALAALWDRYEALDEDMIALRQGATTFDVPREKKGRFRRFLVLGADGAAKLTDAWYSDVKVDDEGEPVSQAPTRTTSGGAANGGLSEALAGELAIQRRDILAVAIAQDPAAALIYAQFAVLDRIAMHLRGAHSRPGCAIKVDDQDKWEPVPAGQINGDGTAYAHIRDSQARRSLDWVRDELDWSWCEGLEREQGRYRSPESWHLQRFDRFRALSDDARAALFAFAVATSLKVSAATSRTDDVHDRLGELLAIDVAVWWRPTKANYFGRINVDDIKTAITEASGGVESTTGKKGELAGRAQALALGKSPRSDHVNKIGERWVPEAMRFRVLPATDSAAAGEGA